MLGNNFLNHGKMVILKRKRKLAVVSSCFIISVLLKILRGYYTVIPPQYFYQLLIFFSKIVAVMASIALFPISLMADAGGPNVPEVGSTALLTLLSLAGIGLAQRFLSRGRK